LEIVAEVTVKVVASAVEVEMTKVEAMTLVVALVVTVDLEVMEVTVASAVASAVAAETVKMVVMMMEPTLMDRMIVETQVMTLKVAVASVAQEVTALEVDLTMVTKVQNPVQHILKVTEVIILALEAQVVVVIIAVEAVVAAVTAMERVTQGFIPPKAITIVKLVHQAVYALTLTNVEEIEGNSHLPETEPGITAVVVIINNDTAEVTQ
jgi:hypothetical protein